jgi:hypothetical protein
LAQGVFEFPQALGYEPQTFRDFAQGFSVKPRSTTERLRAATAAIQRRTRRHASRVATPSTPEWRCPGPSCWARARTTAGISAATTCSPSNCRGRRSSMRERRSISTSICPVCTSLHRIRPGCTNIAASLRSPASAIEQVSSGRRPFRPSCSHSTLPIAVSLVAFAAGEMLQQRSRHDTNASSAGVRQDRGTCAAGNVSNGNVSGNQGSDDGAVDYQPQRVRDSAGFIESGIAAQMR